MARITVRKVLHTTLPFVVGGRVYVAPEVWRIYRDGYPVAGWYVVRTSTGSTLVKPEPNAVRPLPVGNYDQPHHVRYGVHHTMATVWHGGISAGDLARRYLPEDAR